MSKKRVIPINFQISGDEKITPIDCDPNKPIGAYKNDLVSDSKYKSYVFGDEDQAFISADTLCAKFENGSNIVLYPNSQNTIIVNICYEDTSLCTIRTKLKMSSSVSDLKEKIIKEKWESKPEELDQNDIQIIIKDEVLKDEEYIFSYKESNDLSVKATIPQQVKATPLKYFFQFPDNKISSFELKPNKTFSQINEMEDFNIQDYCFYFQDEKIDKTKKISVFSEAQNEETPIQLKINYLIQINYEGSKSKPQEMRHPFSSTQQVKEVLDELVNVGEKRRKIDYNGKELDEETPMSKIKYKKDKPLVITILPIEYTFLLVDDDEIKFKLPLSSDMTVKDVIKLIQKEKKIDEDLIFYTGAKKNLKEHKNDEKMIDFSESEIISVKKLDRKYIIYYNEEEEEKRIPETYTVKDLLKSNKKYKSKNDEQKIIVKDDKGEILEEDQILSELSSNVIYIELSDPFYKFKYEDQIIDVDIPDDTNYEDAISIVKKKFKNLKKIENDLIEFHLKDYDFGMDTSFGNDIPHDQPIIIKVIDPTYDWLVKETKEDKGKETQFEFPITFSIGEAIQKIEKDFKYKYIIKIYIVKNNKSMEKIDEDDNIFKSYYNYKYPICILKSSIKYTFSIGTKNKLMKKFKLNETIGKIAKYLTYDEKKSSLKFNEEESSSNSELEDRLLIKYKSKSINLNDTFDSLDYNPHEKETIQISLSPPGYIFYSLKNIERRQLSNDNNTINVSDIEIPENGTDKTNCILCNNLKPIMTKKIKIDNYTTIDYFTYNQKVDFKFSIESTEVDDYSIYINDENMTVNEIKILVLSHISEFVDKILYGPNRICLKYKEKEINKELFSEIKYKEGTFINVSVKNYSIRIKQKNIEKEIELDDEDMTVGDLKNKIGKKQRLLIKYRNKELDETLKLKDLHLSKKDFISVEPVKTRVLSCNGKEYKLDDLDLDNEKKLRKHFINIFEIDVDNSTFYYGDDEYELENFKSLPKGAKVVVDTRIKNFNNFEDMKYNKKFKTNESIANVRKYIYDNDSDNLRVRIKSGNKFLLNKTKLFQVEGEIKIEKIKEKNCRKILKYDDDEGSIIEYFDCDTTGLELKYYVKNTIEFSSFNLLFENNKICDDDFICEIGDEINIVKSTDDDDDDEEHKNKNKVSFTYVKNPKKLNKSNQKELAYSEDKEIIEYVDKLHLDEFSNDFVCFERGKILNKNEKVKWYEDVNDRTQKVYVFSYKEINDDDFNNTAKCALRREKAQLKVNEIVVNDAALISKGNIEEGQIKIKYVPMSVGELRKKVALKLGFKREADFDLVSLFIPVHSKGKSELSLLDDGDDVAEVLTDNMGVNIHYQIMKSTNKNKNKK